MARQALKLHSFRLVVLIIVLGGVLIITSLLVGTARGQEANLCDREAGVDFTDVDDRDYGAEYVRCMKALGLSLGRGDGSFGVDLNLTRAQMASFLVRLWRDTLGKECPAGDHPFEDVAEGGTHSANIACLYNLGITKGTTATKYSPSAPLTNLQIALFLARVYQKAGGSCPTRTSELEQAVSCLTNIKVISAQDFSSGQRTVTRSQMAVYMIGLWHNISGEGVPPTPPAKPLPLDDQAKSAVTTTTLPTSTTTSTTVEGSGSSVLVALKGLTVEPEQRSGYNRNLFRHWSDLDGDGCDTRREVLRRDARTQDFNNNSCGDNTGSWVSVYDGISVSAAGSLDIDHLVPLAEAWDSGAHSWDSNRRELFANDESALLAVTARSNRSKSASDPAEWMPSSSTARCPYASAWVATKVKWRLSVDNREYNFLADLFEGECSGSGLYLGTPVLAFPTIRTPGLEIPTIEPPTLTGTTTTTTSTTVAPGRIPPNPGNTKNCSDFRTQPEAQAWFNTYFPHYGDVARLDGNNDGVVCTSLPGGSNTQTTTTTTKPASTTTTTARTRIPPNPGNTKNCSDFRTQPEAQAWFDIYFPHYGDVARLDGNNDGVVCTSLPKGGTTSRSTSDARTQNVPIVTTATTVTAQTTPTTTTATTITTQTETVVTTPTTTTATTVNPGIPPNPGDTKNCSDFRTLAEAQAWYDTYFPHYGDVAKLDRNNDGIVCTIKLCLVHPPFGVEIKGDGCTLIPHR